MAKRKLLKVIVAICIVGLSVVVISLFQGGAYTATSSAGACSLQAFPAGISEKEIYEVSGYGPGTFTLRENVRVSNTVSGKVGFPVDAILAKVRANASLSNMVDLSDSVTAPDGQFAKLIAWGVFNETLLKNTCGGEGVVEVFDHVRYQTIWDGDI